MVGTGRGICEPMTVAARRSARLPTANAALTCDPKSGLFSAVFPRSAVSLPWRVVWQLLYEPDAGLLKLFTPPFEEENRPTFIPGNRENGDQSASAACWAMGAYGRLGQSSRAWELALRLLPVYRGFDRQAADQYRAEPYAMAGDVSAHPSQLGRGGRTWYTASAAWYQFILLEELLGFPQGRQRSLPSPRPSRSMGFHSHHLSLLQRHLPFPHFQNLLRPQCSTASLLPATAFFCKTTAASTRRGYALHPLLCASSTRQRGRATVPLGPAFYTPRTGPTGRGRLPSVWLSVS